MSTHNTCIHSHTQYIQVHINFIDVTLHVGIKCRHYYTCCHDGSARINSRPRLTDKKRPHQKVSQKLNGTCISRMYVTEYLDGKVVVKFISAHSGHDLGMTELPYLSLPKGVKEEIAVNCKLSLRIPPERIMEGK